MTKKYIQLPKNYLSYSQCEMWKHSRDRYITHYMDGGNANISNSGMDFGKIFAESLEHERDTGDILTDAAMLLVPKYDTRDKEIQVETKTSSGWLKIIGRPDMLDSKTKAFYEIKTGKGKWTLKKAQRHPQMLFYAMLIYLSTGVVLTEAQLIWIQTEEVIEPYKEGDFLPGDKKTIKPTGHVEQFKVYFTLQDILLCIADTIRVAKEIELCYISHIKS